MDTPHLPDPGEVRRIVLTAVDEDLGPEDLTSWALVGGDERCEGAYVAREPGVAAGLFLLEPVFAAVAARVPGGGNVAVELLEGEGAPMAAGAALARVRGSTRVLLGGERLSLNLLQRISGVATLTRRFVDAVRGTGARILDTRKTTPGLRALEKYGVRAGGGHNHRIGLYDEAMIKDNHLAALARAGGGRRFADAVAAIRRRRPGVRVTLEIDGLDALEEALASEADVILLDNMGPAELEGACERARAWERARGGRPELEASGGVRLETVKAIAQSGVDRISVGALTHAARSLDIGLDLDA